MMKRSISIFIMAFLLVRGAQAQPARDFVLEGIVTGQPEGMIRLSYPDEAGRMIKDSCVLLAGKFFFRGRLQGPVIASLGGAVQTRSVDDPNYTNLFLEPGTMHVQLAAGHFKNGSYTGSKVQQEYMELTAARNTVTERFRLQLDSLRTERDHEKNAAIRERLAPYFAASDSADFAFFGRHPHSVVTAYMLRFHVADLDAPALQLYYERLGPQQQTPSGQYINDELKKLRSGSPGARAADFLATDLEGKAIRLSDYKGHYVLLDFWASWCVPCRKGNPHLKALYAKYAEKGIEFIGIADDDRAEAAWRQAVEKDGTAMWKHVRRGLKFVQGEYDRSGDISELFGIHTLPTKILIDPKGMIIGRYSEEEAPLDKKLQAVFGY